jgi:hypothetical protein
MARGIEVARGVQAVDAAGAEAQAAELARVVAHIREMAVMAALGEAVGEADGVALGAAVDQRAGDEKELHLRSRFQFMAP